MGCERRLCDWVCNNVVGFYVDFGNSDVNNVSYFVNCFIFNLYSVVFLVVN